MKNKDQITQEMFVKAYNDHLPNKFMIFMYKHFGFKTADKWTLAKSIVMFIFVVGNIIGFITKNLIAVLIPNVFLAILCVCILTARIMNNIRIWKIRKELDISLDDYCELSDKYAPFLPNNDL